MHPKLIFDRKKNLIIIIFGGMHFYVYRSIIRSTDYSKLTCSLDDIDGTRFDFCLSWKSSMVDLILFLVRRVTIPHMNILKKLSNIASCLIYFNHILAFTVRLCSDDSSPWCRGL